MFKPSTKHILTCITPPAVLSLFTVAALADPASAAWTTSCLWNAIPTADRAAVLAGAPQDRQSSQRVSQAKLMAAAQACGVTKAESADAQKALSAYGMGRAAMASLEGQDGVTQAQVLRAWNALPSGVREGLVAVARNMGSEPQKVTLLDAATVQMGQRLNLPSASTPQLRQITFSMALLQSIGRGGIGQ